MLIFCIKQTFLLGLDYYLVLDYTLRLYSRIHISNENWIFLSKVKFSNASVVRRFCYPVCKVKFNVTIEILISKNSF